ncbi:MAG: DUF4334 domain-containing protein [Nodosilinea sp.]
METFADAVADTAAISTEEALSIFDRLDPIEVKAMFGPWKGSGFPTHHPLDGALEAYHWHGKRFDSAEQVHPLMFETGRGGTVCVNPLWLLPLLGWINRWPIPKSKTMGHMAQIALRLLSTQRSGARLRLTHYRGKTSATMIYDHLPIHDVFRRVDDLTVLGLMDLKGMEQPFFFVLQRE